MSQESVSCSVVRGRLQEYTDDACHVLIVVMHSDILPSLELSIGFLVFCRFELLFPSAFIVLLSICSPVLIS